MVASPVVPEQSGVPPAMDANGPADAPCIVLCHGWPDTAALWETTVAALAPHYRCVRFTWPGFEAGAPRRRHTLDELLQHLHAVVLAANGGRPVTLLLHDWGCVFGYRFAQVHPNLVSRVVGLDIGDAGSRAHRAGLTWQQSLGIVGYQLWLALAWRIGGRVGTAMARWMAKALRVPAAPQHIHSQMGYAYWLTWTGGLRDARPFDPTVPMFFAYGERKPFMFHSVAWRDALAARPGCQVAGYRAGHWLMLDAGPAFQADVLAWLKQTD